MTHWADVAASDVQAARQGPYVLATAITPSGPIHVGNMREVLTTEAVHRALLDAGAESRLLYIADDHDPLRKVYPFLAHNEAGIDYEQHVGHPLRAIPCPCGDHDDYAAHFLEPFLSALEGLGVRPEVHLAWDMYHRGDFVDVTQTALRRWEDVRAIIERISKRQLPKRWAPFNPMCGTCGRLDGVVVTSYDAPHLHYECPDGHIGEQDVTKPGIGKLPWRIDWPARWAFLGVSFEAAGKDHHAAGGSWATGVALCQDVFEAEPPMGMMYEFLNLKGAGAMHSSTGLALAATDLLRMTPPEVLRYLMVRVAPKKHIEFDPGLGLLNLVDEFDRLERVVFGAEEGGMFTDPERTYELSCPTGRPATAPTQIPYRHVVTVAQITDGDVTPILERSGSIPMRFMEDDHRLLTARVGYARTWLAEHAPAEMRFSVQDDVPTEVEALPAAARAFLRDLANRLADVGWNGQDIHDAIYGAKDEVGLKPGEAFQAIYRAILGQDRGPRAGFFLASLERAFVVERFRAAA